MHLLKVLESQLYFQLVAMSLIVGLVIDDNILMKEKIAIGFLEMFLCKIVNLQSNTSLDQIGKCSA